MVTMTQLIRAIHDRQIQGGRVDGITLSPTDIDSAQASLPEIGALTPYSYSPSPQDKQDGAVMWVLGIPVYESRRIEPGSIVWGRP
jgi:hypothetical protein